MAGKVILALCVALWAQESTGTTVSGTTTPSYLPAHPEIKETDKNSVPPAKGQVVMLGNLSVYESPYHNVSKHMLVTVYDVFGFHQHVKYIADKLAEESGFLVVIPDLFHGNPLALEPFPPPDFNKRAAYLFNGSWAENKPDLLQVISHYKEKYGITKIGMYGYCWGGKISVNAAADPDFKDVNAIGLVHPSRVTTEDAKNINIPAILLPSSAEPDMLPFLEILNNNTKSTASEHHRYGNMTHGFAGARSDFSNKQIRYSVEDVIKRLSNFFKKIFVS